MRKKVLLSILFITLFLLLPFSVKADDYELEIDAVKCPVIGQKPTYVGSSTPYTQTYEERWVNLTDHKVLGQNEVFEAKKVYVYEYGYSLKSSYYGKLITHPNLYYENCSYSVGGGAGAIAVEDSFITNQIGLFTGPESEFVIPQDNLMFDVAKPTIGGTPPLIQANARYTINSQKWYNTTDGVEMTSSSKFQADKKYKLIVNYSSLYLDNDIFGNFNSSPYYLGTSWRDEKIQHIGQDVVSAFFYFGDREDLAIDGRVTISGGNAPVAGQKISDFTVESNIHAAYEYSGWSIAVKEGSTTYYDEITDPNAVFEVGQEYVYNINYSGFEPGLELKSFEVTNNNKNTSFVSDYAGYNNQYGYASYNATYVIVAEGQTFGITPEYGQNIIYPNSAMQFRVYPDSALSDTYTWETGNINLATVSDGYVQAHLPGIVTITATNSKGESANYDLIIGVPVESIELNRTNLTMNVGDTFQLTATVKPDNATEKKVNWSQDYSGEYDTSVVGIDYESGVVYAIKPGTTRVQAYSAAGKVAYCTITVLAKPEDEVAVTGVALDKTSATLEIDQTVKLTATVSPSNATNKTVTWSSSNTNVAVVDETGVVTGKGIGNAVITAQTPNGKKATANIKVHTFYNVTFYDDDKTTVLKPTTSYESGTSATAIERPMIIEEDRLVTGWYSDENLTQEYTFEGEITSDLNLYAKWEAINVSITTDVASVDFGTVYTDATSQIKKKVEVTNNGNVAVLLTITNPTGSGPFGSLDFNNTVLEPGQTCIVTVISNPSSPFHGIPGTYQGVYEFKAKFVDDIEKVATANVNASVVVEKAPMHVAYTTHVQYVGWQQYVRDGVMAGTSGKSLRLEGIKIKLENQDYPGDIEYTTHVQYIGWQDYVKNDEMAGTSGKGLRLEGIRIRLTGEMAENFSVYYRVHAEQFGWLGWAKDGEDSGTAGYGFRLEGIEIKLIPKNEEFEEYGKAIAFRDRNAVQTITLNKTTTSIEAGEEEQLTATITPTTAADKTVTWTSDNTDSVTVDQNGKIKAVSTGTATITATTKNGKKATCNVNVLPPIPGVAYTTHVQYIGWQNYVSNGAMAGTSGKSLRLEGIKIKLKNLEYTGDIEYTTHVQYIGWQDYVKNDEMAGTSGKGLRLEGIRIRLTGEVAEHYDIYYRVHAQQFGWLGWAKNGEDSGTAGYGFRLEGIEIQLVDKNADFPDYGKTDAFKEKK